MEMQMPLAETWLTVFTVGFSTINTHMFWNTPFYATKTFTCSFTTFVFDCSLFHRSHGWCSFAHVFQQQVDLTSSALTAIRTKVFVAADRLLLELRHVKFGPEAIIDILLLMVPPLHPIGVSPLTPEGIHYGQWVLPDVTKDDLEPLLETMSGSTLCATAAADSKEVLTAMGRAKKVAMKRQQVAVAKRRNEEQQKQIRIGKSAGKAAVARARTAKSITTKRKRSTVEPDLEPEVAAITNEIIEPEVAQQNMLYHIYATDQTDIAKIDDRQAQKGSAFKFAALRGCFAGEVKIVWNGQFRSIKGIKLLRQLFKTHVLVNKSNALFI